jgi:glycosyltransferase involved in cell wall biosynthesis
VYKILYIVSNLRSSGTTSQLFNLVSSLDKSLFKVYILTLSKEDYNSRYDDFTPHSKILSLNTSRIGILFAKKKMLNLINEITPDIIHTHCLRADFFGAFFIKNKYKVCNTVHSHSIEYFVYTYGKLLGTIVNKLHMISLKRIKYRISCSYSIANYLKNYYKIESDVVQNGVIVEDMYHFDITKKVNLRKKYSLDEKKILFIYAGGLTKLKNVEFLIDSFKKCDLSDTCQLIMLGDGELRGKCESLADRSITIKGNVDNVKDYLLMGDIIVSASQSEGLPMSIIEGMNSGLPVLLSNISAHYEILMDTKEAGTIFENNNFFDFKNKLMNLIESNLDEKKFKSRETILNNFSSSIMSKKYEKIYLRIIAN